MVGGGGGGGGVWWTLNLYLVMVIILLRLVFLENRVCAFVVAILAVPRTNSITAKVKACMVGFLVSMQWSIPYSLGLGHDIVVVSSHQDLYNQWCIHPKASSLAATQTFLGRLPIYIGLLIRIQD